MSDIVSFDRIPLATPFPWGRDEIPARPPKSSQNIGAGMSLLRKRIRRSDVSDQANEILRDLLDCDDVVDASATTETSSIINPNQKEVDERYVVDIDPDATGKEEQNLSLAQDGKLSLFGSILRVVESKDGSSVSTRHLLRTCCLAIRPGDVPPHMDCKEMVMAALHFLSCCNDSVSTPQLGQSIVEEILVDLPLIEVIQEDIDLEKRLYEKHTPEGEKPWLLSDPDFRRRLRCLERVFMSSSSEMHSYLGRERTCPRLSKEDEKPLLFKGSVPAAASSSARAAAARKRKAAGTPTPSEATSDFFS
mmetsp:Transcript_7790/g.11178  ORF Transcript_7790/g.11178 Transcript_7790/m.11178 type:complete len:306 (+) Transcript_7790:182-1099(+)